MLTLARYVHEHGIGGYNYDMYEHLRDDFNETLPFNQTCKFSLNVVSRYESVDPHRVDKLTNVFVRLCRPCFCSADDACTGRYDTEDMKPKD
jgi:hypothetical protein